MESVIKAIGLALAYTLIIVIIQMLGFFHPFFWTYAAVFAAAATAVPYFLLCRRFPIPGIAILLAVTFIISSFIIGEGHEYLAVGSIALACLAEAMRKMMGNYRGRAGVVTGYAFMSLIPFTTSCTLWIDYETAMQLVINRMGDIYAAVMGRMLSKYMLIAMIILTLVIAVVTMVLLTRDWRPSNRHIQRNIQ